MKPKKQGGIMKPIKLMDGNSMLTEFVMVYDPLQVRYRVALGIGNDIREVPVNINKHNKVTKEDIREILGNIHMNMFKSIWDMIDLTELNELFKDYIIDEKENPPNKI